MFQTFYRRFIRSYEKDPDVRNREVVLNCILVGLFLLGLITAINSYIALVVRNEEYVIWRFVFINLHVLFFGFLYWYSRRRHHHRIVSWVVVGLFFGLGMAVLARWGLQDPVAGILISLTVVMAGILLGARYSLYVVGAIFMAFLALIYMDRQGLLHPELSWTTRHISVGDAVSFSTLFAVIALISWLFNRQMEQSLRRAQRSEKALKRQRDLLEVKVEERTRELQAAQLQKMQHFYRFAELGHLSTAFFHDLANFSTSLSLDAEGLQPAPQSDLVNRIQKNIRYINDVVRRVNLHMQTKPQRQRIDVNQQITEVVDIVAYSARKRMVSVVFEPGSKSLVYYADVTRFRQLIMNLLSNAVEAYSANPRRASADRSVRIEADKNDQSLVIMVTDHGKGITPAQQRKIFEPFYSSKAQGTGIGLFVVRQVAEQDFKGNIQIVSNKANGTVFTVTLPLKTGGKTHGRKAA